MPNPTQVNWAVFVDTGAGNFSEIEGLSEIPDFTPIPQTTRNANTIDHARNNRTIKQRFNRLYAGAEIDYQCENLASAVAQEAIKAAIGLDAGIDFRIEYYGSDKSYRWQFTSLVHSATYNFASANDESAYEMVTFKTSVNTDVVESDITPAGA